MEGHMGSVTVDVAENEKVGISNLYIFCIYSF